ncbi:MAG: ankyrin repeat domain-containing protein [Proteobacteria bacterium]|nr:ankyrin repeat domain-containing protein [Pseudomonadota bacterium]
MRHVTPRHLQVLFTALLLSGWGTAHAAELDLLGAVERNDVDAALALLDKGDELADVHATQPDGATALHWAAHWDAVELAQRLIAAGAPVNAGNEFGVTPISVACRNGSEPMVEALLAGGADVRTRLPSGETALMSCARTGSTAAVEHLLSGGANPNAAELSSGQTALMWAAAGKHTDSARLLIQAGAELDARSKGEFTPLMFAARSGALEIAHLLIGSGATINAVTSEGLSPLLIAAASLDAITGSDYRLVMQESEHEAIGLLLLEHGADVAQADQYGMTPLHYSVEMSKPKLLAALLDRGADPNAQLSDGLPFRRGDYVGREAYNGASPFWLAARLGELDMMRALLAAGADPELPSAYGVTPLMVAAGLTQTDSRMVAMDKLLAAVKMLTLEVGADVHAVDRGGQTAVHGAANTSGDAIIRFLVDQGADPMAADRRGQTPHDVATRTLRPRPSTAALLLELAAVQ